MFITQDFLLQNETARHLYHTYAKNLPIIDYHCHLDPQTIYENKPFSGLCDLWLSGDHYKWRLMRTHDVPEKYITGNAAPEERLEAFLGAVEDAIGNPMYHWCALELSRCFDVDIALKKENASAIAKACDKNTYTPRDLIEKFDVRVICTTDDPQSDLKYHRLLQGKKFQVLPTFRPDKAIHITAKDFVSYIQGFGAVSSFSELKKELLARLDFFMENGCRVCDCSVGTVPFRRGNADAIFHKVMHGESITPEEAEIYQTELLIFLGKAFQERNLVMQFHMGALRNVNRPMFDTLGPDAGFDTIGYHVSAEKLSALIDAFSPNPKMILYSLNANDNDVLAAMTGNFPGVRFGSAWWFHDHIDGMREQMKALARVGSLARFLGMLTDSRSFLSYSRHEYFRRILCQLIGEWVEKGEYPNDEMLLKTLIENICYHNAEAFFGFSSLQ